MKTKNEIERFEEDYKRECKDGLKLFAWITGTWILFGIILLLIFI